MVDGEISNQPKGLKKTFINLDLIGDGSYDPPEPQIRGSRPIFKSMDELQLVRE